MHHLAHLEVSLSYTNEGGIPVQNGAESSVVKDFKAKQDLDLALVGLKKLVSKKRIVVFSKGGMVYFSTQGWLCVSNIDGLRKVILREAHNSLYSIDLGCTKMY